MTDQQDTDRDVMSEAAASMQSYFTALPMSIVQAESLDLPELPCAVKRFLAAHGCVMVEREGGVTLNYPEGTTSVEVLPRAMYSRFRVALPEGTRLYESRPFLREGDNCLWVPQEVLQENV